MPVRTIDECLSLPYTIVVVRDDSDYEIGYIARVVELPSCLTQADDLSELGE
ncbi:MAG: type II toxin-antitoxin system HicB family antitoxin [Caldilineaceae bacterium]